MRRRKLWSLMVLLASIGLLGSGCARQQPGAGTGPRVAGSEETTNTAATQQVTVTVTDSGISTSPVSVTPGDVQVVVTNRTGATQVVNIAGPGGQSTTRGLEAGQSQTLFLPNVAPGTYSITTVTQQGVPRKQGQLTVGQPPTSATPTTGGTPAPPAATPVTITVSQGSVTVTPSQVRPGPAMITVINNAYQSVMVSVAGPGGMQQTTSALQPGQSTSLPATLQAGNFTVTALTQGQQPSSKMTAKFSATPKAGTGSSASTVSVTIAAGKLTLNPQRVQPGAVIFNITNNSSQPRMVTVSGPGGVNQRTNAIASTKTAALTVSNVTKGGQYTVMAQQPGGQAPTPVSAKLTVTGGQIVAGTQEMATTVKVNLLPSGMQLSPQQAPPGMVMLSILNNTYYAREVTVKSPDGTVNLSTMVRPSENAMLTIQHAQAGAYAISAPMPGQQAAPAYQSKLTISPAVQVVGSAGGMASAMVTIMANSVQVQPKSLPAGPVQLLLTNSSTDLRVVKVRGSGVQRSSQLLQPGEHSVLTLPNTPAGSYTITAAVPNNAAANLTTTLTLTGGSGSSRPSPSASPSGQA